jgi:ferredoxin
MDEFKKIKTKDGKTVSIKVDRGICIGAASCSAIAPLTFAMDDQNLAYLISSTDYDDLETVMAGAMSCPVFAIIIQDETGKQIYPNT